MSQDALVAWGAHTGTQRAEVLQTVLAEEALGGKQIRPWHHGGWNIAGALHCFAIVNNAELTPDLLQR